MPGVVRYPGAKDENFELIRGENLIEGGFTFLTKEDVDRELTTILSPFSEGNITELQDALRELDEKLGEFDTNNVVEKRAFTMSRRTLLERLPDIVSTAAVVACASTTEYNYGLYIDRMRSAAEANALSIVKFGWEPPGVTISIDLTSLGTVDEWMEAVKKAAKETKSPKRKNETKDPSWSSYFWKEKVYGAGREGVTIKKLRKRTDTWEDITSKYKDKYDEIIRQRLSYIDPTKAPFWYLIQYGNQNIPIKGAEGGTAYPEISKPAPGEGHDLQGRILKAVVTAFDNIYDQFYKVASDFYRVLIENTLKTSLPSLTNIDEAVSRTVEARIVQIAEVGGNLLEDLKDRKTFYSEMARDNVQTQYWKSSKGNVFARVYQISLEGKKTQLRKGAY